MKTSDTRNCVLTLTTLALLAFYSACGKEPVHASSYHSFFETNKNEIVSINRTLLAHPAIKRIDPNVKLAGVAKYSDFENDDIKAYKEIENWCLKHEIEAIVVDRFGNTRNGDLAEICYVMYRTGLVTTDGAFVSISYIEDSRIIEVIKNSKDQIESFDINNWYLVRHAGS